MILIGFGANLPSASGAPSRTFLDALHWLETEENMKVTLCSRLWKTAPVGTEENQPWYINAVFAVKTDLRPDQLLDVLLRTERHFRRVRTTRNAARPIDLDLLDYNRHIIREGDTLTLPHPRMTERAFVLLPLQDICPDWVHPATGQKLSDLIHLLPEDQIAYPVSMEVEPCRVCA